MTRQIRSIAMVFAVPSWAFSQPVAPAATTTYAWTNSNTTIGLAASGSGPLPAFT